MINWFSGTSYISFRDQNVNLLEYNKTESFEYWFVAKDTYDDEVLANLANVFACD